MIKVTLKGGDVREYENGTNLLDMAKSISEGLARNCLAADVNGETKEMNFVPESNCEVSFLTFNDENGVPSHRLACFGSSYKEAVSKYKASDRSGY